ncbi:MAG: glycosyltransferase family 2 protein [bacterium]|nr:glycosyltransferase family 2 protein [bacterium]
MEKQIKLSIIIPAYNEEKRLPKTLEAIDFYMRQQSYSYEIIVVNDGSKDQTSQVVGERVSHIAKLRMVDNKENHGKGYVVRQGMTEARGDFRIFTDADNSTSIEQIEKIWAGFNNGFDVVIGSRDIKGAVFVVKQAWWRRLIGDVGNLVIRALISLWGIPDTQCGFKGFTKEAAGKIFSHCIINRWAFDIEVLALAKKFNFKIKQVPVVWENNVESRVRPSDFLETFIDVIRIKKNFVCGKYNI